MTGARLPLPAVLLVLLLGACGPPAPDGSGGPDGASGATAAGSGATAPTSGAATGAVPAGTLTVFAAASTTDALEELGRVMERRHPGVTVRFNLAGSQQLAAQLLAGAPADVFASANHEQMQRVVDAGLTAGQPTTFATNRMTIAVEPGNPAGIDGLADLAADGLIVVLAARQVPAGDYADRVLAAAGVSVSPDSREPDVRQVLTKVATGEADAALVYRSDAVAAGDDVATVEIAGGANVTARYPVAVLADAGAAGAARRFVDLLGSRTGRRVLARHGFGAP